jgi:hypothetical protein
VLMPQGTNIAAYRAFFVWPPANKPTFKIRIEGAIPSDVVGGTSPTTNVYRARCELAANCDALLVAQQVTICAERPVQRAGLLSVSWLPFGARQQACGAGG